MDKSFNFKFPYFSQCEDLMHDLKIVGKYDSMIVCQVMVANNGIQIRLTHTYLHICTLSKL